MNYQPFFVTGAPKSGTTWLTHLLNAHPQLACGGESCIHHFGQELLKAVNTYNSLIDSRRPVVGEENAVSRLSWPDALKVHRRFIELRLDSIADPPKPDLRFVGDKDPEHYAHLPMLLNDIFPEGKVIHLIRDGRAVLISAWHHNLRSKDVRNQSLPQLLDQTAKEWTMRIRRAREFSKVLGGRYFEVRYEDLHTAPQQYLRRTLEFLGADARPELVEACVQAASFEKLSKGRKAGEEDKSSFFRKGMPDDWRNHLTPAQITRFDQLSGGYLAEAGYSRI